MQANVGGLDKVIRIVAGLALLSLLFILQDDTRWLGLIGIVPLFTALAGWCPAYSLFGINTCSVSRKKTA